ncbi:tRNA (guanine(10)-N2)-methyltransferase homolog isoform X1 [Solenopsis invicta]|uniref:tRNA (guanine(10)-N2)-methyltransferase homolog isoform X1 n=1 Tax=Solenopsis invicta TaxID=13686 RepID=UPI000E33E95E|nr:tRNA (guanine(10)-N2)-methyltransferase homolog isoform X1 [Solenopsis invicta]
MLKMSNQLNRYLFWFAHEHVDFRLAEMESIFDMFHIDPCAMTKPKEHPYWIVDLPDENAVHQIASRAVSLRFCLELWGQGKQNEDLHSSLKTYSIKNSEAMARNKKKSFKIVVETFCKHFSQHEKINKIESFSYLPLEGSVKLKNPDITLCYIEYYGLNPNDIPEEPHEYFFGRWIADGQRELIQKLSLKTRKFIGNTSMDPQLSLIMANQAQIRNGDLVFDPFVGTGSLLIAASQFGGYTFGTDIDFLMLHGRTRPTRISQKTREKDESIAANMRQYGMSSYYLDVVVADFSYPLWRANLRIDAIVTDPPYGIREATERIGSMKINPVVEEHQATSHIPSKIVYGLNQIYRDLLCFSARHLRLQGRLVCWYPLFRDQYTEDQLPAHSCLELTANSEQILSNYTSRRLLTYKKVKEPEETDESIIMNLTDFREKYFALREETRKEKRMRKAAERARRREEWERSNKEVTER